MATSPASARVPTAFFHVVSLALSDDGKVGENDAPALRALAEKLGRPDLGALVDTMESKTELPTRRNRLHGTGYGASVVAFNPGAGAGFNAARTEVVLGRPEGAGANAGSLHVLSLGHGGSVVVKLGRAVTRGLVVFENAFGRPGGRSRSTDPATVEVSSDGHMWWKLQGQAGFSPVFLNSNNRVSPRSKAAGGDRFAFADAGIPDGTPIQYARIVDATTATPLPGATTAGFDLDAVYGF